MVKTPPFHGGIMGSNPVRVIIFAGLAQLVEHRYRKPRVTGSTPAAGIIDSRFKVLINLGLFLLFMGGR